MYKNVAQYGSVQRDSTQVEYEHEKVNEEENIEKEEVRQLYPKQPSQKATNDHCCKR